MFAVETFVGRKFGGWARSGRLFDTMVKADLFAIDIERAERKCSATPMHRRVVPI